MVRNTLLLSVFWTVRGREFPTTATIVAGFATTTWEDRRAVLADARLKLWLNATVSLFTNKIFWAAFALEAPATGAIVPSVTGATWEDHRTVLADAWLKLWLNAAVCLFANKTTVRIGGGAELITHTVVIPVEKVTPVDVIRLPCWHVPNFVFGWCGFAIACKATSGERKKKGESEGGFVHRLIPVCLKGEKLPFSKGCATLRHCAITAA